MSISVFNGLPWFLLPVGLWFFSVFWVIHILWGILFICCNQFLLYSCILSKTGVLFQSHYLFYNLSKCILLFSSYISSLLLFFLSLVVMVQFSLPFNTVGRASVLHSFILVFLKVLCCLNILLIMPAIFT